MVDNKTLEIQSSDIRTKSDYDPYQHRSIQYPNTYFGALTHLLKCSMGTGFLAVASAFAAVGIVGGIVGTLFTGVLCAHTVYLLVNASLKLCEKAKVPTLGFSETANAVCRYGPKKLQPWASTAESFVDVALVLTYYATAAVIIVLTSTVTQELVDYYNPDMKDWTIHYYLLILLIPLILFNQIRELKHLVPFSFIANVSIMTAFVIIMYYMFSGIRNVEIQDRKLFSDVSKVPQFFSKVLYAMEGIGHTLPLENTMVKPQFLGCFGVLNISMSLVTLFYIVIGLFGYIRFGDNIDANISAELPLDDILAQITKVCIAVSCLFSSLLFFYVAFDITWKTLSPVLPKSHPQIIQVVLRTVMVILIVGLAAAVPKFDSIVGLVGSVFYSILGLFIPAVIDILLNTGEDGDFGFLKWRLCKNIFIVMVSLFALISGSYDAIKELSE